MLRAYHELIGELLPTYGGTLEHFAGDGVMAFFNDPVAVPDHELQAIRFALAAQERFDGARARLAEARHQPGAWHRDRSGSRNTGTDRLRRSLRLRGAGVGHEPRLPAEHRSRRRVRS